jgi:hypothetical protein
VDSLESFEARARQKGLGLAPLQGDDALDRLRGEVTVWFDSLGEPPLYRRSDEGLKQRAQARLAEGELLLARLVHPGQAEVLGAYALAVRRHAQVLLCLSEGRVEAADLSWREAVAAERAALQSRRIFERSDEALPKVYDRGSGTSRFDPRPEPQMQARLMCPHQSCRKVNTFSFSPRVASHLLDCPTCGRAFKAHLAQVREVTVEQLEKATRRYLFRVEELSGVSSRVEFDDASGGELSVARRDLVAFLYSPWNELYGVLNLSSGRVLWVAPAGGCFLATAVYGEGAAQLAAFRWLRDGVLVQSAPGRAAVHAYYAVGPAAARWVVARPGVRRAARAVLDVVHAAVARGQP